MTPPVTFRTVEVMGVPRDSTLLPPTTVSVPHRWPPPVATRSQPVESSWTALTLAAIASIWTAVVLISVFSPDMVHGSEHQRMPIAAFGTWIWGFGASIASLLAMARLRGDVGRRPLWIMLSGATVAIWSATTLVSIFGPTVVTGSDPTTIPLAALISPIVATVATIVAGTVLLVANSLTATHHHVR